MSNYTLKRLSQVYNSAIHVPFDYNSRIIIMSDCHRGIGNWGDNFAHNQNIYFAALSFYYNNDYTYIELGDGDELWENRCYDTIIRFSQSYGSRFTFTNYPFTLGWRYC